MPIVLQLGSLLCFVKQRSRGELRYRAHISDQRAQAIGALSLVPNRIFGPPLFSTPRDAALGNHDRGAPGARGLAAARYRLVDQV